MARKAAMAGKPYFSCDQLVPGRGSGIVVLGELHVEIHQCSFDFVGEFWITKR